MRRSFWPALLALAAFFASLSALLVVTTPPAQTAVTHGSLDSVITTNDTPRYACVVIADLASTDDHFEIWMPGLLGAEIQGGACYCRGTCTNSTTIGFEDRAGNLMNGTITCAKAGANATFTTLSNNTVLQPGEGLAFNVTNTPNPDATDEFTICFTYILPASLS